MSELSKIISELNLPKQLLEKGEAAFKAVLGPSIREIAETWGDSFKLRRFKNQVNIFIKAQKILEDKGIESKSIDLKVLVPMLENCSLEEDENLQEKWANLIANIVTIEGKTLLKQNCIEILKKISNSEAQFLDLLCNKIEFLREKRIKEEMKFPSLFPNQIVTPKHYPLHSFQFGIGELSNEKGITKAEMELIVSNLVALGLVKWTPEIEVSAEKADTDPEDTSIDVDVEVHDSESIKITNLGYEFVLLCKDQST